MTEPTARRLVDRAHGAPPPQLSLHVAPESTGKWPMVQGAFIVSTTACMLILAAATGAVLTKRRYIIAVVGVVLLARGIRQWSKVADRVPFPTTAVLLALLGPFGVGGFILATELTTNRAPAGTVAASTPPASAQRLADVMPDFRSRDPETRCRAAEDAARGEKTIYNTELSVMLMWDFDARAKKCARDAFARLLQSQDEQKRLTTIHTLSHEAGGPLFDELLQSAADNDPSERNRSSARGALERRMQWRKR
jgi:hypothetical protein